jgi:hypothetical protein
LVAPLSRAELKGDCGGDLIATMLFESVHRAQLFKKQDKGIVRRTVESFLVACGLALALAPAHGGDYRRGESP